MPAAINFFALDNHVQNLNSSGLGFFGSTFGDSVEIGEYQDSTYITNSNGTTEGPQATNIKFVHPNSGSINGLDPVNLLNIPNYLATLNVRFTNDTAVRCQNAKFYVYDRVNINNNPSGVLCKVAEIVHPSLAQTGLTGSGSTSWQTVNGSGSVLEFTFESPGYSGLAPSGNSTVDTRMDYYIGISASPSSVGSKTFAGYFSVEYL
jgi:hypothetical protein